MRKKVILSLFLVSFSLIAQETWVKTYRPFQRPNWTDRYEVEDVIITQDGGYVISGSYEIFGYDPHEYENWAFLMKTDSDGNLLWAVDDSLDFMLSNGYDIDFTELSDGSLLSIGYSAFGGGGNYMIKRDSEGNQLWALPYANDFGVFSMKTISDGNVILAGGSNNNAALRKIDPDGNTIWTSVIDVGHSVAYSVYETSDGGYALAGKNYENYDVLAIKTDINGDSLWTRTYAGFGDSEQGNCIIETNDNELLLCGWLYDDSYLGFLWKMDYTGATIWANSLENIDVHYVISIVQSSDNNYVLQGNSRIIKIDNSQNILWNEPLSGQSFGLGDKNLVEIELGGYICVATENYGNNVILNKTDENGQVTDISHNVLNQTTIELINFPNPFNPSTTIYFGKLDNYNDYKLQIYNTKGQLIKKISIDCNEQSIIWDGKNENGNPVSSGIYYYKLKINGKTAAVKKCLLLK